MALEVQGAILFALARHLGIPVVITDRESFWDGTVLRLSKNESLAHEIGHWIVAKKYSELDRANYGCTSIATDHRVSAGDFLGEIRSEEREAEATEIERVILDVVSVAIDTLKGVP